MPRHHAKNEGAAMTGYKAPPLQVIETAVPEPGEGEVLIKNHVLGINPVDWKVQDGYLGKDAAYPHVMGEDIVGEIVQLGPNVDHFQVREVVMAHPDPAFSWDSRYGGFQKYTVAPADRVCVLPEGLKEVDAASLPLATSTAANGLYAKDKLALPAPQLDPTPSGRAILVWGGSSSVGGAAIQLARASGLEVVSTASKHNTDLVLSLGASAVFDHRSNSVVDEMVAYLKDKPVVGAFDAIGTDTTQLACAAVLSACPNVLHKYISTVLSVSPKLPEGFGASYLLASAISKDGTSKKVWHDYLPRALRAGQFRPALEPRIVGHGLDKVQEGMDLNKAGLSAQKAVILLD